MSNDHFTLFAWRVSWYSAKVRSYLQVKGIPFIEKKPSLLTFKRTIPKHCGGDAVVPVLVSPEGDWLQDSSLIIEQLERRFPAAQVLPTTPIQRILSLLIEIWADEFWHPTAEHYRFSFPENYPIWRDELATLLPGFPRFMQHALVKHFYQFMLSVAGDVGVTPQNIDLIERWSENQLDTLDQHFSRMPFLLGERPSLADFSLMGPINGHLNWDPRSVRVLIEPRPHLKAWLERMSKPLSVRGEFLADDQLPNDLQPVMDSLFKELLPYLQQCVESLQTLGQQSATDSRYPRLGPKVEVPYGEGSIQRVVVPYTLWMLQRLLDEFAHLSPADAASVRNWLKQNGGEQLLELRFPRVRRVGLHIAPEVQC
jgi:glutathione S-transferase